MTCAKCGGSTMAINQDGTSMMICAACDTPDRMCTWCRVPMMKKLVGKGDYLHYICPKCFFQHTTKHPGMPSGLT